MSRFVQQTQTSAICFLRKVLQEVDLHMSFLGFHYSFSKIYAIISYLFMTLLIFPDPQKQRHLYCDFLSLKKIPSFLLSINLSNNPKIERDNTWEE